MEVRFSRRKLENLYVKGMGSNKYPNEVIKAFAKCIRIILAANSTKDLRSLRSLNLEKLKRQPGVWSMRLNISWRLEVEFEEVQGKPTVVVLKMNNHYAK